MRVKIEYVNDDWMRVYVNGQLISENHSISVGSEDFANILRALVPDVAIITVTTAEPEDIVPEMAMPNSRGVCPLCCDTVPNVHEHLRKALHKPATPTPLGYVTNAGRFVPLNTK